MPLSRRIDAADRAYLAGLGLGAVALAALGLPGIWATLATRNDFAELWAGARSFLDGHAVYDPATWTADLARLTGRGATGFGYPPYVLMVLAPLALLPLPVAATAWTAGGLVLAVLALRALLRAAGAPPAAQLVLALTLLVSAPSLAALAQGQWSFLLTAALAATAAAQRAGRGGLAGLAALPLAAKPHLVLFAGWAIVRRAVRARQRATLVVLAVAAAAIVASVVWRGPLWAAWATGATAFLSGGLGRTATLGSLAAALVGPLGPAVAAALVLAMTLLALVAARDRDAPWLALSIAAAPYAQAYDHVLLLVPLALASGALAARSPGRAVALAAAGAIVLIPLSALTYAVAVAGPGDPYGAIAPLAVFLLVVSVR